MKSRTSFRQSALIVGTLLIIASSLFFGACKKDDVKVTTTVTVSGFSPSSGPVGTVVVIAGSNFSTILSNNTVTFNGTPATVSAATAGQITTTCPSGATSGKIAVIVSGTSGTATSSGDFIVTP